ncbi:MAG: HAMP domain-containing histidine kinase [Candidatus Eisenbacteria bacterium]|uniref:histidine kinase n=1 Tax=Eiseniibacteriota bacterium TaxID=2212470 RepID=A0A849SKZ0_UNCEI|nr:HAMP domain-containing histidine kinase [Candidatus Eisenbacteria bacterium]
MRRVEQSMDMQEDAFLLFQTATALEGKIQQRTAALNAALSDLAITNQALERARDAANAANAAKSAFLANMSHELRTPLHGILSFARFGLREAEVAERSGLREYFTHIHDSGQTLLALLNDVLDLAKLESGRMHYEWECVDLEDLVSTVMEEFGAVCRERGISLTIVGDDQRLPVWGDSMRLRQVIRNLIDNAVRYTKSRVVVSLFVDQLAKVARIMIADDGPGIPEDELGAIFEKFIQSSATGSGAGGTGLGLAITREILAAHHGRAWAENQPHGGAVLTVELPLKAEDIEETSDLAV